MAMIVRNYPEQLEEIFGNDLVEIFGTEEEQATKISLRSIANHPEKINALLSKLPNGGVLDVYQKFGKKARPSFLDVAIEILKMFKESGIFNKYKLPPLGESGLRLGGVETDWTNLFLRYPVQRDVKVWHILRDILVEWDDTLNDPAYVRVLSDGTMNVNDKQHGNFGRLLMGAEKVYVEGIISDTDSMDTNMYASRNIHNLESSWENNANVRVTRAIDYQCDNEPVKLDDAPYLEFYTILEDLDCSWQEKSLPKKEKVCQNGKKLFGDFCMYGDKPSHSEKSIFEYAVAMNVSIWPHGELAREFVWGACEFLKQMKNSGFNQLQMRDIRSYIKRAMEESYQDTQKSCNRAAGSGTLWGDVLAFKNSLVTSGVDKDWRVNIGNNYLIAAGIRDLILNWNAYHKDESNITKVKLDLPLIKEINDQKFEVEVGFYPGGISASRRSVQPYYRATSSAFNHTVLVFDEDEAVDEESETV